MLLVLSEHFKCNSDYEIVFQNLIIAANVEVANERSKFLFKGGANGGNVLCVGNQ